MSDMRDIPGWEGYLCDRQGNVFSRKGAGGKLRGPLKRKLSNSGYHSVHLRRPGVDGSPFIHRLVLMAWIGPGEGLEANHKNGDRLDNRLENLEWVTPSENQQHSMKVLGNKLGKPHFGVANASAKLDPAKVRAIRRAYANGALQKDLADRYGIWQGTISAIVRRTIWRHIP